MSFDDLAFPNMGVRAAQVTKVCPACDEERVVAATDLICPSCGERLIAVPQGAAAAGAASGSGIHADSLPMLRHLMSSMAAASNAAVSLEAGGEDAAAEGENNLAAQLQSLFVPALNSTYADMVSAQRGISIDELMTRLLQESSLQTANPASKAFIEHLHPRALVSRDFLQLYMRFKNLPGFERDVFPTVAAFGAAGGFLDAHAAQQAEERATAKAAEADAAAAAAPVAASSSAADPSSASTSDATAASSSPAAPAASSAAAEPPKAGPAALEHSSGGLIVSNPLSMAPPVRNSAAMRGSWVLSERGAISFVAKARAAQDALAKGLIVLQTEPDEKSWPYAMSDSTGKSGDVIIPCVMMSQSDGAALQAALKAKSGAASSQSGDVTVTLMTRERPLACCICREDYELNSMACELPCHHFFCPSTLQHISSECIMPWLQSRANCPLCRFTLPTDAPKKAEDPAGPDSNQAQLHRDMFT